MAKPRHHRTTPGESGAGGRPAVSLLHGVRRQRAANDNRLGLGKRLQRRLPFLVVAVLLAAMLWTMAL